MACHHRDDHRVYPGRRQDDHHADGLLGADRHARHRDPHAAHRPVLHHCAPDEADDLRAAFAPALADAAPADGPPAWEWTASALRSQVPAFPPLPLLQQLRALELPSRPARAQGSPPLRSLPVVHHQTFSSSFYASADNLAHSSATLPAGRNFTVTALLPIRSAINAVRAFW